MAPIYSSTDPNSPTYDQLMARIEELEANLSRLSNRHEGRYVEYENRFDELHAVVQNYSTDAIAAVPDQVPLYANCTRKVYSTCTVLVTDFSICCASYTGCETGSVDVDSPGVQNINMYCSVANEQETNPVISTLNIYDGAASLCVFCSCS